MSNGIPFLNRTLTVKTTRTTATQGSRQRNSETTRSARRANASQFQVSDISIQEQIARLAYAIWEHRDCSQGTAEEDWKQAERELRHCAKGS